MNALDTTSTAPRAAAPVHPTHKFKLLLQREFWEHKGGFLWAPLIAGGISLLLTTMMIVFGLVAAHRAASRGDLQLDGVNVNGLDIAQLTSHMSAADMVQFAQGIDLTLFLSSAWPFIVLAFVAFFYCLGALYDERKDRSVLFWKSLPLSDSQTVLSKVVSVALVAPVLAVAAAIATMFGFMILISVVVLLHGGNPWTLLWGPANPLQIAAGSIVWIPVYALWALPTIGWLMLCSVWARSKPFLWALMVPLFAGIFVSWFDLMEMFDMDSSWFWTNVVGRLLLGTVPGMDLLYRGSFGERSGHQNLEGILHDISPASQLASLATPGIWIGAVVGAVMIYAAIQLRRHRELAD
jgi:ABC-2 type transport system permease protein